MNCLKNGLILKWDNKITTFPGLYLVSSAVLWPFRLCSVLTLRLISLAALNVNLYRTYELQARSSFDQTVIVGEAVAIASLPPMYLFGHLYCTDVLSIMTLLAMMLAFLHQRYGVASICGCLTVLVRQTNIVWVGMFFGMSVSNIVVRETLSFWMRKTKNRLSIKETNIGFSVRNIINIHFHVFVNLSRCFAGFTDSCEDKSVESHTTFEAM